MITIGLDIGSKFAKAAAVSDGDQPQMLIAQTGFDQLSTAQELIQKIRDSGADAMTEVPKIVITGIGAKPVTESIRGRLQANVQDLPEVVAAAVGAHDLLPSVRTVIDLGAEKCRIIKCTEEGVVRDFVLNEKCAAGGGAFLEVIARILGTKIDEMDVLAMKSAKPTPMNTQCTVFAESEAITLMHQRVPPEDIASAVFDGFAERVGSLTKRIVPERDVAVVGGVGRLTNFLGMLSKKTALDFVTSSMDPIFVPAYGAALVAQKGYRGTVTVEASQRFTRNE